MEVRQVARVQVVLVQLPLLNHRDHGALIGWVVQHLLGLLLEQLLDRVGRVHTSELGVVSEDLVGQALSDSLLGCLFAFFSSLGRAVPIGAAVICRTLLLDSLENL